ncbi:MAG: FxSxx-COOH system tetratricopeptide repeat protein [Byssovorax sp.]
MPAKRPVDLVFLDAAEDGELRRALKKHLASLERDGVIRTFSRDRVDPGADAAEAYRAALERAEIVVILVSSDLLASDALTAEVSVALERDRLGQAAALLVEARPVDWAQSPFASLTEPGRQKPSVNDVALSMAPDMDAALAEIAARIRRAIAAADQPGSTPRAISEGAPASERAAKLPPIWNVPHARNPTFTGRSWNISTLHAVLRSGRPGDTVQALSGLGGIGKTQIALEYAYRYAGDYDVVWWMRAEEPSILAADFASLAAYLAGLRWMSFPREPDQRAMITAVQRWLSQNGRWLLVFDSAREPGLIVPYLPGAATGHVLITTRNASFRGVANLVPIREMERVDSIAFLQARTGQQDRQAAQKLCEALGDLPLALAQAGAYIEESGTTFAAYLETFERRRRELLRRGASQQALPTVATTWDIAIKEVQSRSPAAAELLNLCAFLAADDIPRVDLEDGLEPNAPFPPPPALGAAMADPLALDEAVAALRRFSLIEAEGESLSVHRLVQLVVRDRLTDDERRLWAGRALCVVHAGYATEREDTLSTRQSSARWLPHVRIVCEHAEAAGVAREVIIDLLIRVAKRARTGDPKAAEESRKLYEKALKIAIGLYGDRAPACATIWNGLARTLTEQDDPDLDAARRAAERALAIDQDGGDHDSIVRDCTTLALVLRGQNDLAGAKALMERWVDLTERRYGKDHAELIPRLNDLAVYTRELGDPAAAFTHLTRALSIGQAAYGPDHEEVASVLSNLASVLSELAEREREQGNDARARELLEEAKRHLARTIRIGGATFGEEHYVVAVRRNNLGLVLKDLGDLENARAQIEEALRIVRKYYGPDHRRVVKLERNLQAVEREMARSQRNPKSTPGH